jgi:hypothetical protein
MKASAFPRRAERKAQTSVADALAIYLTDHFAGATFGLNLLRRCCAKNEGTLFAAPLTDLVHEVEADRSTLLSLLKTVGAKPSVIKTAAGWTLERLLRLKPNGDPFTYTPLSRMAELELLVTGIAGKRAMWVALDSVSARDGRLDAFDFRALAERAERQLDSVERLRLDAVALTFGSN